MSGLTLFLQLLSLHIGYEELSHEVLHYVTRFVMLGLNFVNHFVDSLYLELGLLVSLRR